MTIRRNKLKIKSHLSRRILKQLRMKIQTIKDPLGYQKKLNNKTLMMRIILMI